MCETVAGDGAGDDVEGAEACGPFARVFLDGGPGASVEFAVLRADVGEVVAVVHCLLAPFHVGRGGHMPAVVARAAVVVERGAAFYVGVRADLFCNPNLHLILFKMGKLSLTLLLIYI